MKEEYVRETTFVLESKIPIVGSISDLHNSIITRIISRIFEKERVIPSSLNKDRVIEYSLIKVKFKPESISVTVKYPLFLAEYERSILREIIRTLRGFGYEITKIVVRVEKVIEKEIKKLNWFLFRGYMCNLLIFNVK